jgi:D-3-phosphoglycerate dehydrogenase
VRIINCARGGLIDEAALKEALDSAAMSPAPRSTCSKTEPAKENPLFGTPNFICTPHLGASTNEAQVNVALQVAEQMADYLVNGGVTNALNMPSPECRRSAQAEALYGAGGKARFAGRPVTHGDLTQDQRSKGRRSGRAQHQADYRCRAGRLHAPLFGCGEHGQRALSRQGARLRRARSPP